MQADFAHQLCAPLHTARLLLQPLTGAHADAAFGPMQDDALYQWISMDKPQDATQLCQRWARLESRLSPDGLEAWPTWAVTLRADGTLIGRVDAVVNTQRQCTNFGYYFFHAFWGQCLATEAVQAAADHLLRQGISPLVATVTVGNTASTRVLEKAGFVFKRILPGNDTIRGVPVDDAEFVRNT